MPTTNQDNVRQWLDQSNVDYFTYFVKAWIPFNAWYRHAYDTLRTEREILDAIKSDGNRVRSRFPAKLEGADPENEEIRNAIATLHRRLLADPLDDRNGNRLSFENVLVGPSPHQFIERKFGHWIYRVERIANSRDVVSVVKTNRNRVERTITQVDRWNLEEFELHADYLSLNQEKRARLRQCYIEACPQKFQSLLTDDEANSLIMDGFHFVPDKSIIFAGLVEILYGMRNLLFHGELVPDPTTNRTYEPAYHLLRQMIRIIT